LSTITIKTKDLATEITNFNVKKSSVRQEVRALLCKSGIKPEEFPSEIVKNKYKCFTLIYAFNILVLFYKERFN